MWTPRGPYGQVLNIGGGREPTSINRMLEIIAASAGAAPDPVHTPARESEVRRTEADTSLARRLIGYEPTVDLEEGLDRTVAWFRSVR